MKINLLIWYDYFDSSNFCFYSHRNDREYAGNVFVDCLLGHQSWAVVSWSILFNLSDNTFMLQNLKCIMFQTVLSCWLNIIYLIQIILNVDVTFFQSSFWVLLQLMIWYYSKSCYSSDKLCLHGYIESYWR